ncbi:hypothetical protein [Macrococcus bovicus]|uniref:Uncharacterized protein n=1 Tax=Macrococcus bovicus TaxID=69968 RepID=A0A4R6BX67_9STAP|nr:hypothetical protein [Macrococcus bovicus]TDM12903.1 hypothetical protein ERX55_10045 [Macrococcus bovicus]
MKILSSISLLSLTSLVLLTGCNSLSSEKNNVDAELNVEKVSTEEDFKKHVEEDLKGQWICSKPTVSFEFREGGKFIEKEGYVESKVGTYEIVSASKNEIKIEQTFGNEMKTYYITLNSSKESFELKFSSGSEHSITFDKAKNETEFEELLDRKRDSIEETTNKENEFNSDNSFEYDTESIEDSSDIESIEVTENNNLSNEVKTDNNSLEESEEVIDNNIIEVTEEVTDDNLQQHDYSEISNYPAGDERIVERYRYMTPEEREAMIRAEQDVIDASQDYQDALSRQNNYSLDENISIEKYNTINPDEEGYATDDPNFKSNE